MCLSYSFAQSVKAALPFVRLTLSDLTFASLVLGGKTREDLLAFILRPYHPYEREKQAAMQQPKGVYLRGIQLPTSFLIIADHSMPSRMAQRSALLQVKKRAWNCPREL